MKRLRFISGPLNRLELTSKWIISAGQGEQSSELSAMLLFSHAQSFTHKMATCTRRAFVENGLEILNTKHSNAVHEIGHYLVGRRVNVHIKGVTIIHGKENSPANFFARPLGFTKREYLQFALGGWAAEAYDKAHDRESDRFNALAFAANVPRTGCGAGWPLALATGGQSDIARLVANGVSRTHLLFPLRTLLEAAQIIHEERALFFRLVDMLLEKYYLSERALSIVVNYTPWTAAIDSENEMAKLKAYSPDKANEDED